MSGTLTSGARFALKRTSRTGETPRYEATIETPDGQTRTAPVTFEGASPCVGAWSAPPAEWAIQWIETLAQRLGRTALRSGDWPRKVRQWKASP